MPDRHTEHFLKSWRRADCQTQPYRHWLLKDVLPEELCTGVITLPIAPPPVHDTQGRRETNNATRVYFNDDQCKHFTVCNDIVDLFRDSATVEAIEQTCKIRLRGRSSLRIEYTQDREGFWLEPHPDVPVKLFTMLIYLGDSPGSGTDIYDGDLRHIKTAPFHHDHGLVFIPANDTWHGFEKRPIHGVRRSLIVNYVTSEWRDRWELAGEV